MSLLYGDTAVILRAALVPDKYGVPRPDWENAARITVPGVSVQPDSSAEESGDRSSVVTGWRLFTPKGTDFPALATDRVEFGGMTLQVDGEVGRYRLGTRLHHAEARLKRVTG